ncbi:hypothetical protein TMatcc_003492 [Talaromyces marneffei ATCC 18224]|uniref:Uncharacterized protein n=2 Tax=Talaromyces marneffei TaxID=37727 RepID=B6Q424_TALMQ|nr:uncharacterized protein EYB26_001469 [Talaromyces marneffei]EEA28196.1 conserved hypothetical protein [Talaromyces marneffei ATCC 18224]KAE8556162.1 hypothetical protein EYB25_000862 [Talaromyces marneffei]QGA13818.1 hypothetical protein EYB26_001469 [Talaromyces marneffei]
MFELPDAKRIRRDEIVSPSSSTRSSPEIIPSNNEEAHARLGQLLAFDISTPTSKTIETNDTQQKVNKDGNDDDEEEEFEFRLFSAPKPTTANSTAQPDSDKKEGRDEIKTQKLKIRLRSPTPVDIQPGDGRFIVPFRGWRYYFTKPGLMAISARNEEEKIQIETEELTRRKEYEDIAITGDEVLDWAKNMRTPGCHLPWRVFRLDRKYHRVPKSLLRETYNKMTKTPTGVEKKKSKPGKKRRIILRTRAAALAAEKAKAAETANMTEAEKRNKKNRERKIKRRQKEREKKAALAATATTADGVGAASMDGDSSD